MPKSPYYRVFLCEHCGREISRCKPARLPKDVKPTFECINSCAVCAQKPSHGKLR